MKETTKEEQYEIWEQFYNPNFNSPEFRGIKENIGSGGYFLSVK